MIALNRVRDQVTLVHEAAPVSGKLLIGLQLLAFACLAALTFEFRESPPFLLAYVVMVTGFTIWSIVWTLRHTQTLKTATQIDVRGRRVSIVTNRLHTVTQRASTEGPIVIPYDDIEELRLSAKTVKHRRTTSLLLLTRDGKKHLLAKQDAGTDEESLETTARALARQTDLALNDTINPPTAAVLT